MVKSCKLSEEMIVQILSTLPPKSLIRFKCVRKLWLAIINHASFMAKNLSTSVHNKFTSSTCFIFKRTILKDNNIKDEEIYHVLSDDDNNKKQVLLSLLNLCNNNDGDGNGNYLGSVVEDYNVPLRLGRPYILRIVGHCDGIVCLNTFFDDIALCNPAIKEFKFLPKSCLTSPQDQDCLPFLSSLGFGYDSKAKDYKVVRVAQGNDQDPSRVEVYTLGANSWREVKVDIKSHVFSTPNSHLYFKGTCYWMAYMPQNDDKEVVLVFDVGDELFRHISVPDNIYYQGGFIQSLFVWKESIVLLSYELYRQDENPKSFEIWVLNDFVDVVEDLWTKHLTIGPLDDIELPLVFWTSDELLMAAADGHVLSYNLCTHTFKYIPIHGVEGAKCMQAFVYVNSIVSVKER